MGKPVASSVLALLGCAIACGSRTTLDEQFAATGGKSTSDGGSGGTSNGGSSHAGGAGGGHPLGGSSSGGHPFGGSTFGGNGGSAGGSGGSAPCQAGLTPCEKGCVDTSLDPNHCQGCGNVCPAGAHSVPICSVSGCGIACDLGFGDCDADLSTGCENVTDSVEHCGSCDVACDEPAPVVSSECADSECVVTSCEPGFADCNGEYDDGCEINTNTDEQNCGGCTLPCASACVQGACTGPKVLIVAADEDADIEDVESTLEGLGSFGSVDVFKAINATPSLVYLEGYSAVLVFSNYTFQDPALLGNRLADYFDQGGHVVVATFANYSGWQVQGRWVTDGYRLLTPAVGAFNPDNLPLQILEPSSPLVTDVTSLTAGLAYRTAGAVINGGVVVAKWGNGTPLIVRSEKNGHQYVELNFFPPSASVETRFWTGDGAEIMRNALLYE